MALKDVKARLANRVQTADPAAKVYTFKRNLTAESDLALLKGSDGRVHFWHIYRESTQLSDLVVNESFVQQEDTIVIEGFFGVQDSADTEELFDAILDAVLQGVEKDRRPTSSGTKLAGTVTEAKPPVLRKHEWAYPGLSNALCHHAEIVIRVTPRYLQ